MKKKKKKKESNCHGGWVDESGEIMYVYVLALDGRFGCRRLECGDVMMILIAKAACCGSKKEGWAVSINPSVESNE